MPIQWGHPRGDGCGSAFPSLPKEGAAARTARAWCLVARHGGVARSYAYAWPVDPARQPTLTEVARLAGVSLTTASKAINRRERIAETTRKRVLRAARQLSYAPNLVAKSLASGRSSIIGVLLRDPMVDRLAMPMVIGAQSMLEQLEFSAIIADARGEDGRLVELAVMLRQRSVDGLLIIGDNQGEIPSIAASAKIPCVYVHSPTSNSRDVVHLVDDFAGAVTVVNHLVDVGRARIAHITGPKHSPAVQQRALGVTHALSEHGLRLAGRVRYGLWSQRWARQAMREVLAKAPDVDAIACGSDQIAAAALEVVMASGRKVPDDVAIAGYDNWAVFAQETDPPLTTLDMELEHLGAAAVSDLFAMIGGNRVGGGTRHHEGTLVIRGSTDSTSLDGRLGRAQVPNRVMRQRDS
ncbi:MAG: LacI family DNA-binding transcriptional regulator [Acidimicrobiales bacterium]